MVNAAVINNFQFVETCHLFNLGRLLSFVRVMGKVLPFISPPDVLLILQLLFVLISCEVPTHILPSGVKLPMFYLGFGNFSAWLQLMGPGAGIQTAWGYHNENTIPPIISASGLKREDIYLSSMLPCGGIDGGAEPMNTTQAEWYMAQNLLQLNTTYIDVLLLHHRCRSPDETKAVWSAMEGFKQSGMARAIGVSNFDSNDLRMLLPVTKEPIEVNEAHFAVGEMDYETIAFCNLHNISLIAYSTLSGSVPMTHPTLVKIAAKHGVSSAVVMMRFVSAHGISVLSSSGKEVEMKEDVAMFDLNLSENEIIEIAAIQDGKKRTCPDCYTDECQGCARTLQKNGCPVGEFPIAGRGNPNGTECMNCAERNHQTVYRVCGQEYMVAKACGA